MDLECIHTLVQLNNEFYRANHESFSQTREKPWVGWERVLTHVKASPTPFEVLDVACGNMRFERYMSQAFASSDIRYTCIDSCADFATSHERAVFQRLDVIEMLIGESCLAELLGDSYNMVVSFGFLHHVPSYELRLRLIRNMAECLCPESILAISFWRFMDDARLRRKALSTTQEALPVFELDLEHGDYLLDWNLQTGRYRYCHHFEEEEIASLVDAVSDLCELVEQFEADGKSGHLNTYVILRKKD